MTDVELQGATAGGLPYPESTDDFNQGANNIKALALALEGRGGGRLVQIGQTQLTFTAAVATLVFPTPFKTGTTPIVFVSGGTGSNANNQVPACVAVNPTNTQVNVSAVLVSGAGNASTWLTNGAKMNMMWLAIGTAG